MMTSRMPELAVTIAALLLAPPAAEGDPGDGAAAGGRSWSVPGYSRSGHDVRRLDAARLDELAAALDREEARVLLHHGTEPSFTGDLLDTKANGVYVCRLCGLPLFSSAGKFESGTGWPSFFEPIDDDHVSTTQDASLGMVRTEIHCTRCSGHLGHVFSDGPRPTGLRYCVNSVSLDFFGQDDALPARSRPLATAYFAGGCFWGVEDRFQQVPGVLDAVSGYQGGQVASPTYRQVCSGTTGHAESVRVTFDPAKVSYVELLEWFFRFHDPTQLNRQGPDVGSQYRSAIFAADDEQLADARRFVERQQRRFDRPIVTRIERHAPFFPAEAYHQDYHARHGGSCPLPPRR